MLLALKYEGRPIGVTEFDLGRDLCAAPLMAQRLDGRISECVRAASSAFFTVGPYGPSPSLLGTSAHREERRALLAGAHVCSRLSLHHSHDDAEIPARWIVLLEAPGDGTPVVMAYFGASTMAHSLPTPHPHGDRQSL